MDHRDDSESPPDLHAREHRSSYFHDLEDLDPYMSAVPMDDLDHNEDASYPPASFTPPTISNKRKMSQESPLGTPRPTKVQRTQENSQELQSSRDLFAPFVVAELQSPRELLESLPYGVQWEIARFISIGAPHDSFSTSNLRSFQGLHTNVKAAPEVAASIARDKSATVGQDELPTIMSAKEQAVKLPWQELDMEEKILKEDPFGGIGCNQDKAYLKDDPDWYGGRVHFTAQLVLTGKDENSRPKFKLYLQRPVLGSSNRFARRFGSHRFVRVGISQDIYSALEKMKRPEEDLVEFFGQPIVILGWVFRAFFSKEDSVFLFRTSERWDGKSIVTPRQCLAGRKGEQELTLLEFLKWHNDPLENENQTMAKWSARFALGLSNSVPGARLAFHEVKEEEDIICAAFDGSGKAPNEMIMTDGCGIASRSVVREVQQRLRWLTEPVAIQMRLGGAKGLLLTDSGPTKNEDGRRVCLRQSQIKIRYPQGLCDKLDPAMLTVDILKPSKMSTPARLSTETIINLAENGVTLEVFVKLMKDGIRDKVDGLTTWNDPSSVYELWKNVFKAGGVVASRLIREAPGTARAKGVTSRDEQAMEYVDEDGFDKLGNTMKEHSTPWWGDPTSGCPSTLQETVLVLLDSGFRPESCPVLASKLKELAKMAITSFATKFHIHVPMSCTAFVVPDPCGVLEPGEVHIKSCSRNLIDQSGNQTDIIIGDVLLTRHPCKVPTDVQKARAVFHPELRSLVDVVVVSIKDHPFGDRLLHRHLASMTGGGDYDGDTMEAFWDPTVVSQFRRADPIFAEEPITVKTSVLKNSETVAGFIARTSDVDSSESILFEYQRYLLGALRDVSMVGTYSMMWETSIYKNGYADERTLFMAYMFTTILDGSKTGITVSKDVYSAHRQRYKLASLPWKRRVLMNDDWKTYARRGPTLPPFIMDQLLVQLEIEYKHQKQRIETLFPDKGHAPHARLDQDLAAPWQNAQQRAAEVLQTRGDDWMKKELEAIKAHVQEIYVQHRSAVQRGAVKGKENRNPSGSQASARVAFTELPIDKRQDVMRELSLKFERGPASLPDGKRMLCFDDAGLRRVRASYAYVYDQNTTYGGWSRFPFDMAMRTLCEIKAGAVGQSKTLTEDFYMRMTMSKAFLRSSR